MPEQAGRFTRERIGSGDASSSYRDFRSFERIRGWARKAGAALQTAWPTQAD